MKTDHYGQVMKNPDGSTMQEDVITGLAKETPSSGSERRLVVPGFEYEETQLQFACTHSVYPMEGQSSVCYVTSEERAKFMVAALNHFKATGAMDEYLRQNS